MTLRSDRLLEQRTAERDEARKALRSMTAERDSFAKIAEINRQAALRSTEELTVTNDKLTEILYSLDHCPVGTSACDTCAAIREPEPVVTDKQRQTIIIALEMARFDVEHTREQLRKYAERLAERMSNTVTDLGAGRTLNSLGEVQGQAMDVDRLCALLPAAEKQLERVERIAEAFGIPADARF